jgi:hypothetical protein
MRAFVETRFLTDEPVVTLLFDPGQLEVLAGGLRAALKAAPSAGLATIVADLEAMPGAGGAGEGVALSQRGRGDVVRCAGSSGEGPEPGTRKRRRKSRTRRKDLAEGLLLKESHFRRCPIVSNAPTALTYRMSLDPSAAIAVDEAQLRLLSEALRSAISAMGGPDPASPGAPSRWELRELDVRVREVIACWDDGELTRT